MASLFVLDHFKEPSSKAALIPLGWPLTCLAFFRRVSLRCMAGFIVLLLISQSVSFCILYLIFLNHLFVWYHAWLPSQPLPNTCKHFAWSHEMINHSSIIVNDGTFSCWHSEHYKEQVSGFARICQISGIEIYKIYSEFC